jgi:1,2-diacylglycerol 3-alpha-glucosyltransferase
MAQQNGKKESAGSSLRKVLLFFLINIAIVLYIAYREFGTGGRAVQSISSLHMRPGYLILAAGCLAVAVLTEMQKYRAMMVSSEGRDDLRGAFECAVLGKYYDNITPLGAGGQPFQIIYLKKRGMSSGSSAALPIAGFLALQFAFLLIAAVVFVFNGRVIAHAPAIRVSAYVGFLFYLFIPLCVVLFSIRPASFGKVVCGFMKLLSRLHLIRSSDTSAETVFRSLNEYAESLHLIRQQPHLFAKLMIYSLLYQMAILSVPYFVLRAFGTVNHWWAVFSLVVYIYAAITIIPTPGNSGAAEGSFYLVFSSLTGGYLFWAMLIWRLFVYYGWLLLGLIVLARRAVPQKLRRKREIPSGPLRVALFSDIYYPTIDGVVRTVDAYARRLSRDGGYCCVVCPRAKVPFEDRFPYDVYRTPAVKLPGLSYLCPLPGVSPSLRRMLRKKQFDVFHVHSPFLVGRFAVRLGHLMDVPVIATFHSKYYDDALNITHSRFLARLMANYTVSFYSKADVVWACSRSTAETLRSYGFRGEVQVMENGVDIVDIPDPGALRERAVETFQLPKDRHILLFVGQQIWQKNLRLILDVTKQLQPEGRYLTVIAGKGYDSEAICRYAESLDLGGCVKFTGGITDRDLLRGLYLASDLFFFPSLYDNAPLVLREAALMGLPALLVEGSNSAEVVTDGVNGYTAENAVGPMSERIRRIFSDGSLEAVGERAHDTIPESWDDILTRVRAGYRAAEKRRYDLEQLSDPAEAASS